MPLPPEIVPELVTISEPPAGTGPKPKAGPPADEIVPVLTIVRVPVTALAPMAGLAVAPDPVCEIEPSLSIVTPPPPAAALHNRSGLATPTVIAPPAATVTVSAPPMDVLVVIV